MTMMTRRFLSVSASLVLRFLTGSETERWGRMVNTVDVGEMSTVDVSGNGRKSNSS